MKLPSFFSLWLGLLQVIRRFPLQFILILLATVVSCWLIEVKYDHYTLTDKLFKLLVVCNMGLTLLLAGDLFSEANELSKVKKNLLRLVILVFSALVFLLLTPSLYHAHIYKLALLIIVSHLLVSFAAFLRTDSTNGFWQFNKTLFLRFTTAVLYTTVLYIGLAIALFAVNNLFSLHLHGRFYQHLLVIVGIGFNTLFFLAGVPNVLSDQEKQSDDYPKGLKIFTQYVLIPLMSIYLPILLLYEVKIALSWELPKGLVSSLIIGYAFFGILSLLLIYPIRNTAGNRWVILFSKFFYWMMIPLLVLLILAIYKRVGNYGITEPRYFLISIALWLSFVTAYFLISAKQHIKIIPISLCVITILAIYGPQSAFTIAKHSQVARLKQLNRQTNEPDNGEKVSIIRYLVKHYGLVSLQPFTESDLQLIENDIHKKRTTQSSYTVVSKKIDTAYALLAVDPYKSFQKNNNYNISILNEQVTDVSDWNYLITLDNYQQEIRTKVGEDSLFIQMNNSQHSCRVQLGEGHYTFQLDSLIGEIDKAYQNKTLTEKKGFGNHFYYPAEKMQQSTNIKDYTVQLSLTNLYVNYDDDVTNDQAYYITFKANLKLKKMD